MAKRLDRLAGREDARERFGAGAVRPREAVPARAPGGGGAWRTEEAPRRPMGGVRCIGGAHGVHCRGGGRGDGQEAVDPRSSRVFPEREGTA